MPKHIVAKKLFFCVQPPYFSLIPHGYWAEHREVGAPDLPIDLPMNLPIDLPILLVQIAPLVLVQKKVVLVVLVVFKK